MMCNENGKECNPDTCKCQTNPMDKELKSLLAMYNKELSECESAIQRTEKALNNLGVQRQQLIGARYAIESAISSMNKPVPDKITKGETKNGKE